MVRENPYISLIECARLYSEHINYTVSIKVMREICKQGYLGHFHCGNWVITKKEFEDLCNGPIPRISSLTETRERKPLFNEH